MKRTRRCLETLKVRRPITTWFNHNDSLNWSQDFQRHCCELENDSQRVPFHRNQQAPWFSTITLWHRQDIIHHDTPSIVAQSNNLNICHQVKVSAQHLSFDQDDAIMSTNLKMSIQTGWTDDKSAEFSALPATQQRYTCTNGRRGCSWFDHQHCGIPEKCTIPEHTRFVVFPRGEVDDQAKVLRILLLSHTHQPHQSPMMFMIGSHHHETLDEIHHVSLFFLLGNISLLHQSIIHAKPLNNQSSIRTYRHHYWNTQLIEFSYAWTSGIKSRHRHFGSLQNTI